MPIKTQFDLSEQARVDALASINLTDPLAIDKDIQTKFTATGLNDADSTVSVCPLSVSRS